MRLVCAGGGTLGPVSPLLAVYDELRRQGQVSDVLWIGTRGGIEHAFVAEHGIQTRSIQTAKFRRYLSWQTILDPFRLAIGYLQARRILKRFRPDVIITAGGYVAVPVVWAAPKHCRVLVHQQDVIVGLANRLMVTRADRITVSLESSQTDFPASKVVYTGNAIRSEVLNGDRTRAIAELGLDTSVPTVLVVGGGTGALSLNELVAGAAPALTQFCNVVHLMSQRPVTVESHSRYHAIGFAGSTLADLYAAADLVVTRAGMSTLSELSLLEKPAIVVPMPGSHQEANAEYFFRYGAAQVIDQTTATPDSFTAGVQEILDNRLTQDSLRRGMRQIMPRDGAARIAALCV